VCTVNAGKLKIDDQESLQGTGIMSDANPNSEGNAGTVTVTVDDLLEMFNGAAISCGTWGKGNAGSVTVNAKSLNINGESGISSSATSTATGYVGDVIVNADDIALMNKGKISISADQTLPEDRLDEMPQNSISINTKNLHLDKDSKITAESTANVPAGAIQIEAGNLVVENNSRITTSSNDADGGHINIQGDDIILMDGLVTTSVEGLSGDGGDITIEGFSPADVLVLSGGFVQANTAAQGASGGNIFINAKAVIAENDDLQVGGQQRQEFESGSGKNVIQAAAPGGEQGTIDITAPDLDISSALTNLSAQFVDPLQLPMDPCLAAGGAEASSLVLFGRGGIPEGPDEPSAVSFGGDRLDRLQDGVDK